MATIIAGGFAVSDRADAAMQRLLDAGVDDDNLCSFRVNPPGEHSQLAIGGDRHESPGATKAGGGAAVGAAVGAAAGAAAGMAASPLLGPVAIAGLRLETGEVEPERGIGGPFLEEPFDGGDGAPSVLDVLLREGGSGSDENEKRDEEFLHRAIIG